MCPSQFYFQDENKLQNKAKDESKIGVGWEPSLDYTCILLKCIQRTLCLNGFSKYILQKGEAELYQSTVFIYYFYKCSQMQSMVILKILIPQLGYYPFP